MLDVLFIAQGNSESNLFNLVPALLDSVLREQPKLDWKELGRVTYVNRTKKDQHLPELAKADILAHTIYVGTLTGGGFCEIFGTNHQAKSVNPNILRIVGGPIHSGLAEAILLVTGADFYFADSALWSFRKFCEHVAECKEKGIPLDREYLSTLPGLFQRVGEQIIHPKNSFQPTEFLKQLEVYPDSLLAFNLKKGEGDSRIYTAYPMMNRCTGGCSFCAYDPVGVPLSREQRQAYAEQANALAQASGKVAVFSSIGPNFDFNDKFYLYHLQHSQMVMCTVTSLLKPGEVGTRSPNLDRINDMLTAKIRQISVGVESLIEEKREEMGKQPFTNQELEGLIHAIGIAKSERGLHLPPLLEVLMLPPDISTSSYDFVIDSIGLYNLWTRSFRSEYPVWLIVEISKSQLPHLTPFPDTPDFEVLRLFHERFPELFERYHRKNSFRVCGNNEPPILYEHSLPFDPIARMVSCSTIYIFHEVRGDNPLKTELWPIFLKTYLDALGLHSYATQAKESRITLCGEFSSHVEQILASHQERIELLESVTTSPDIKPEHLHEVRELFNAYYTRMGKEAMAVAMERTPLRDPKAYELWKKLGRIRRAMTQERKRGNSEWRKVGRALV